MFCQPESRLKINIKIPAMWAIGPYIAITFGLQVWLCASRQPNHKGKYDQLHGSHCLEGENMPLLEDSKIFLALSSETKALV